jgi:tetratricopeptide (TPR) repeat protein
MATLKLLLLLLLFSLYSCAQNTAKHVVNPQAALLEKQVIPLFAYSDNPDSCKKALLLLDSATTVDSDFFMAYANKLNFLGGFSNKLFFLGNANQTNKAINAIDEIIRLQPNQIWFTLRGNIYEKTGDTISAKKDFQKSLSICNQVLDTMSKNNQDYFMFVTNKAVNLIMLNDSADANKILEALYENYTGNSDWDKVDKEYILSLINKNKQQLMQPPPAKDSETDIYLNQ